MANNVYIDWIKTGNHKTGSASAIPHYYHCSISIDFRPNAAVATLPRPLLPLPPPLSLSLASALCQLYKISFINNNTICQYPIYIPSDIYVSFSFISRSHMLCLCHFVLCVSGRIICIFNGNTISITTYCSSSIENENEKWKEKLFSC